MLFNSYEFIFMFLPLVLLGYYFVGQRFSKNAAIAWLVIASLFFYGWWNPRFVVLLVSSILFNFAMGYFLEKISGEMGNYWDSSHYQKKVGDMVVCRVLNYKYPGMPNDFGVLLTKRNIDQNLLHIRCQKENWEDENPEEFKMVTAQKRN